MYLYINNINIIFQTNMQYRKKFEIIDYQVLPHFQYKL